MNKETEETKLMFGPFEVTSQVFLTTPHSFALVNLKPLLPGHVLVCPIKPHRRLTELSTSEVTDLFSTVQRVQQMLARHYFKQTQATNGDPHTNAKSSSAVPSGGSFNIALQDGPEAGQTVSHVHVHIIPRISNINSKPDDGTEGDELYEKMAGEEGNVGGALWDREFGSRRPKAGGKFDRIEDSARKARSMEEMQAEAEVFRKAMKELDV
ncbi:Bis-triphosphatase [Coniella lustricola]|uniref:Bis(5'-adenosyl)-triphosphatase n=1 Tax=Coniella lustricola TaxID=2025994 RepID=A0A2T3ABZ3_9PEZI|nr:Bis-triphosphatase [Coniella lustricola]